jgi:putative transposase
MFKSVSCKRHRFPPQVIAHAVRWFRFPLSLRLVEDPQVDPLSGSML